MHDVKHRYSFGSRRNGHITVSRGKHKGESSAIAFLFHKILRLVICDWVPCVCWPGSVAGIAASYRLKGPGIETRSGRDFPYLSRRALGPTQPPVNWIPGLSRGTAVAQWLRRCATNRKVTGSNLDGVIRIFHWHYGPGVDSASNRNEYQEYFLGVKAADA